MNTMQIKCFLALAQTLNFTKAAEQLFISQPGLSRQIVSLEKEINTLLFIRDKHYVKLTPAAAVLLKELEGFDTRYDEVLRKVQKVGQGYSGSLTIGMLGGQYVGDELTDKIFRFVSENPNIDLIIKQGSFKDLRNWVDSGEIDIACTLSFEAHSMKDVQSVEYAKDPPVFAVSKHTNLGKKKKVTLEDLQEETLILISPDESRMGCEQTRAFVNKYNLHFADVRYAPNLATVMVWIEAGLGVGIINHNSNIVSKSSIRMLEEIVIDQYGRSASCFVWKNENYNPAIAIWINGE